MGTATDMATAATVRRLNAKRPVDRSLVGLTAAGASVCVVATVGLAAGHVAGGGFASIAAVAFALLVAWCFSHRRADRTLAALGLYLGLLDGYVKLSTGSPTITLARDMIVVAIAGGALVRAMRSTRRLALPPLGALVVAFSAVVVIELANPASRGLVAGVAGLRQHLEFVPLFFLGYAFLRLETHIRTLLFLLVVCAAAGGVVSYMQSTLTPQELAGWGPGYHDRILGNGAFTGAGRLAFGAASTSVRPFGLGSDAGAGAFAAALALPALIALAMGSSTRVRLALIPLSVGIGLAVATSGSRAAVVAVAVSIAAFGLLAAASKNALRAVMGLALGAALVFTVFQHLGPSNSSTQRAQSIAPTKFASTFATERGASVAQFGGLARDHPFGVGVGTVGPAASVLRGKRAELNSETQWNYLVVEVGLAGLAIYLLLNIRLVWLSFTRIRRIKDRLLRLQLAALAAPLVGLLVAGFAGPTTASVPGAPYFWLVAGMLAYWTATAATAGLMRPTT
jgi:hypothetical protein